MSSGALESRWYSRLAIRTKYDAIRQLLVPRPSRDILTFIFLIRFLRHICLPESSVVVAIRRGEQLVISKLFHDRTSAVCMRSRVNHVVRHRAFAVDGGTSAGYASASGFVILLLPWLRSAIGNMLLLSNCSWRVDKREVVDAQWSVQTIRI